MFNNVNYTYYTDTLGRAVVPTADDFARYTPEAIAYMTPLLPFLDEREPDGIDKATCMVVEEYYKGALSGIPAGGRVASETIDSYSRSFNLDGAKSPDAQKEFWILAYCTRKDLR